MKFTPQVKTQQSTLQSVRDGVLIASATALLAYIIHETTSPSSFTRQFLQDQRRLREVSEELLANVRGIDANLQILVEKNDALTQTLASSQETKSTQATRRKAVSGTKAKSTAKTRKASAEKADTYS